jgi:hypothetical protein
VPSRQLASCALLHESSASDGLHDVLGVAQAGGSAARGYFVDTAQIIGSQFEFQCAGILFQILAPLRAGDRNDILALRKQPGEGELTGHAFLLFGNELDAANEVEILLKILSLESWRIPAKVVGRKILETLDLASKKTAAKRAIRNECDS